MSSIITLTTDFGTQDPYVAQMKGVILSISPESHILDLSHDIPPQDISAAGAFLAASLPTFPPQSIHIAVVDPGVGSARRLILVQADSRWVLAPDNGLLDPLLRASQIVLAWELTEPWFQRQPVSHTFHGRDLFAPAAAHLAQGTSPERFGPRITISRSTTSLSDWTLGHDSITGTIRTIDRFGNAISTIPLDQIPAQVRHFAVVQVADRTLIGLQRCYSDVSPGELLALCSSTGEIEIACRNGNAATLVPLRRGVPITISWSRGQ